MVKIVVKKEGAEMTCTQCGTDLVCRLKDYGGNFAAALQWQNFDGKAHYKTTDGKNFSCNIPDDADAAQTHIPSESATTPGQPPQPHPQNNDIKEMFQTIDLRLQKMDEMVQAIFRFTVDEQLKKK